MTRIYVDTEELQALARAAVGDAAAIAGINLDLLRSSVRTTPVAGAAVIDVVRCAGVQAATARTAAALGGSAASLSANALEVVSGEAAGAASVWLGASLRAFPGIAWVVIQGTVRKEIAQVTTPQGAIHLVDQGWHGLEKLALVPVHRDGITTYRYGPGWGKTLGGLISSKQLQQVGTVVAVADHVVGKVTHVVAQVKDAIDTVNVAKQAAVQELAAESGLTLTVEQKIARVAVVVALTLAARQAAGAVETAIQELFKEAGEEAGTLLAPGVGTVIGGLVGMEVGSLVVEKYRHDIEDFFRSLGRGTAGTLFRSSPEIFGVG